VLTLRLEQLAENIKAETKHFGRCGTAPGRGDAAALVLDEPNAAAAFRDESIDMQRPPFDTLLIVTNAAQTSATARRSNRAASVERRPDPRCPSFSIAVIAARTAGGTITSEARRL